jgi:manganese transport protein
VLLPKIFTYSKKNEMKPIDNNASLSEVHESVSTLNKTSRWKRFFAFFGPAYLVSVGYMDPGNWATDLAGGSKFGYALIWVLLMSNIMALILQSHSARLGIVRGRDLAQANRETYPRGVNFILYLLAEIAIAATDLAEVLGMAIGIHLLTGLPLIWGVGITVLDTFLLLYLQRLGIRKMEAFIIGLVLIIGLCFLINIITANPQLSQVVKGFIPSLPEAQSLYAREGITSALPKETALYLAIGIIGATVMPHNLYLHSALVQTRRIKKTDAGIKQALKYNFFDSAIALNIAFLINASILILAATAFFQNNRTDVAELKDAHQLLPQILSSDITAKLFAVALIASGQSSTITGTLAGQIVMEGYLRLRINPWVRRLLTRLLAIIPAILVILIAGESQVDALLILSQVILSMQLGFAIIPLIHFVSDKTAMGRFAIGRPMQVISWLIASILIFLNIKMLMGEAAGIFESGAVWQQLLVILAGLGFGILLLYTILYPVWPKKNRKISIRVHPRAEALKELNSPVYKKVAIALDFSESDHIILAHAIGQGNEHTEYHILHVVESATARVLGTESEDFESKKDQEQLDFYIEQLRQKGLQASGSLGYRSRNKEIVRIVKETGTELLVIGSHGHSGIKDLWYGETINSVRHELKIPLLIVSL